MAWLPSCVRAQLGERWVLQVWRAVCDVRYQEAGPREHGQRGLALNSLGTSWSWVPLSVSVSTYERPLKNKHRTA